MTEKNRLTPPKPTRADALIEGAKAGLSGPGGILAALTKTPLEKRRDKWMEAVGSALLELQEKIDDFSLESLSDNELFTSTVVQATIAAQRTHILEKRVALQNAVLNVAVTPDLDDTTVEIFLNIIDSLTEWHIKILDLFANPDEWSERNQKPFPDSWYQGGKHQVLEFAYPELESKRQFYDPIVRDLHSKGLLSVDSLHSLGTRRGMTQAAVTHWGSDLVLFIREPAV